MATQNFQLISWDGLKQKRIDTESSEFKFGKLSIGSLAAISEVAGKLDFGGAVITNVGAPQGSGDLATKGYVDTAAAAAGSAAVTSIQADLDALEADFAQELLDRASGDAATLSSAQAYADQKIQDLVGAAPAALDTLKEIADALNNDASLASTLTTSIAAVQAEVDAEESARAAAISAEQSARQSAVSALQSDIDAVDAALTSEISRAQAAEGVLSADVAGLETDLSAETSARQAADTTLDGKITTEKNRAEAAEAALQDGIDDVAADLASEEARALAAEGALAGRLTTIEGSGVGSIAKALQDAKDYADAGKAAEQSRAEAAELALDGRLDVLEGAGAGSVAKALVDAKAYTDAEVLVEKNRALAAEAAIQSEVDAAEASIAAETSARQSAITALQGEVDAVEAGLAQELIDRAAAVSAVQSDVDALEVTVDGLNFINKTNANASSVAAGKVLYVKSNGQVDLADKGTDLSDSALVVAGESIASGVAGKVFIKEGSVIGGFSGLVPGKKCFVGAAGAVVQSLSGFSAGNSVYCVGRAISSSEIAFAPVFEFEY